jgi:radical SAM protein with 4Fe4S-binding SPASM domain
MCYIAESAGDTRVKGQEVSATGWLEIARQARDAGMVFLCLTGGEPFLREDFFEIFVPLTTMGLSLTLFTNATLVTPEKAARLAEAPPRKVEVSIYGASDAVCERVTGVPGSLRRCLAGIDALAATGRIRMVLKTTLTSLNAHELPAMRQLAASRGLPFQAGWLLTPGRDRKVPDLGKLRLAAEEVVRLEEQEGVAVRLEDVASGESPGGGMYCEAGNSSFAINPAGEMGACIDLPLSGARPLEVGFARAWEETRRAVAAILPAQACVACANEAICPRCPALAQLEEGSLEAPVPYLCSVAAARRRRAEAAGA